MDTELREDKYIYCIIETEAKKTFNYIGFGDKEKELYTVCFNGVAAVISDSLMSKYRASRENLVAHEKAIEEVMKEHIVLPVRFATIAANEKAVTMILEKEYDRFKDLFAKMKDKKELGLKAILIEDVIFKEIMKKYKNIVALKEQISTIPPEKTYFQRMKIGEMVENALQKERESYKKDILDTLSQLAVEVKNNDSYYEMMVLNAAFLIQKDKEAEFDEKVNMLEAKYSNVMKLRYIGTVPPFNFVNLVINI